MAFHALGILQADVSLVQLLGWHSVHVRSIGCSGNDLNFLQAFARKRWSSYFKKFLDEDKLMLCPWPLLSPHPLIAEEPWAALCLSVTHLSKITYV